MTLEEYKAQTKEIQDTVNNFKGSEEDSLKLLEDLAKKYPELNEFNQKAAECETLESFLDLAKSYGMEFKSEQSKEVLFNLLKGGSQFINKLIDGELDDETLELINGGSTVGNILKTIGFSALAAVGSVAGVALTVATGGGAAALGVPIAIGTVTAGMAGIVDTWI